MMTNHHWRVFLSATNQVVLVRFVLNLHVRSSVQKNFVLIPISLYCMCVSRQTTACLNIFPSLLVFFFFVALLAVDNQRYQIGLTLDAFSFFSSVRLLFLIDDLCYEVGFPFGIQVLYRLLL